MKEVCHKSPAPPRVYDTVVLVVSLDRLSGQEAQDSRFARELSEAVAAWIFKNGLDLAYLLRAGNSHQGSYIITTLLRAQLWRKPVLQYRDSLAVAWLDSHGKGTVAGHALQSGLKELPEGQARKTILCALEWLKFNGGKREASFVLAPLLERSDLDAEAESSVVRCAISWLTKYQESGGEHFVLYPLLRRKGLKPWLRSNTVHLALAWIHKNKLSPSAFRIISALLEQAMSDSSLRLAITGGLEWLRINMESREAGFVLGAILTLQLH